MINEIKSQTAMSLREQWNTTMSYRNIEVKYAYLACKYPADKNVDWGTERQKGLRDSKVERQQVLSPVFRIDKKSKAID